MASRLGPTGGYHNGQRLRADERGGLNVAFSRVPGKRLMGMNFGAALGWLAISPAGAREQARVLRDVVGREFGPLRYSVEGLPLRVVVSASRRVVEVHLGQVVDGVVANPEMWLALAQRLDEAAALLPDA